MNTGIRIGLSDWRYLLPTLVLLAACGSSPTSPSPQPVPVPVPVPAPTPAPQPAPVLPDPALFDAAFNAQLVHDALDSPGRTATFHGLTINPSIYLQTTGLNADTIGALEQAARGVVPALSGGMLSVAAFESGADIRADTLGWITVQIVNDDAQPCGRTLIGAAVGHAWINIVGRCQFKGRQVDPPLFSHELGHALGFYHVADPASVMHPMAVFGDYTSTLPSAKERYHAGLAYQSNGAYSVAGSRLVID